MNEYEVIIIDLEGNREAITHFADDEIGARMNVLAEDKLLCRNPFVILENCPSFTRKIVEINLINQK